MLAVPAVQNPEILEAQRGVSTNSSSSEPRITASPKVSVVVSEVVQNPEILPVYEIPTAVFRLPDCRKQITVYTQFVGPFKEAPPAYPYPFATRKNTFLEHTLLHSQVLGVAGNYEVLTHATRKRALG